MSQEKTVTVLRRMHDDGDFRHQIWPSDLPANAPAPKWMHESEFPESVAAGVVGARLTDAFCPLPCGDEEAVLSREEWDRFLGPASEDEASIDHHDEVSRYRDDDRWGSW
jgi:hypothetical protein